jgi:selT/selW/selH-like putative selenoprotein
VVAELKENLKLNATPIPGGSGVFDVLVNGKLIYSKSEMHRFPEENEITDLFIAKKLV